MEHSFNVEIAKEYGIVEAILLKHIYYWILKNKANNKYFYDDNYWTYNSTKAFAELFPYLSKRQIEYSLKKLIDKGLIVKGNYNKVTYDRTSWYAITKLGYSILQNCEIEMTNLSNRNDENVKPIPNINTNINTDINNNNPIIPSSYFDNEELDALFKDFLSMRKKIKAVNSDRAITLLINKLSKYDDKTKIKMIENSIENSWKGIYEPKEDNKQQFKHYKTQSEREKEVFENFLAKGND